MRWADDGEADDGFDCDESASHTKGQHRRSKVDEVAMVDLAITIARCMREAIVAVTGEEVCRIPMCKMSCMRVLNDFKFLCRGTESTPARRSLGPETCAGNAIARWLARDAVCLTLLLSFTPSPSPARSRWWWWSVVGSSLLVAP